MPKKSPDDPDIELITKFFDNDVGLNVVDLRHKQTPGARGDLAATDANERYLVEVGGFDDDKNIRPTLRQGKMYESTQSYFSRDQVTKKTRHAIKQLRDAAADYPDHLWLAALIARSKIDSVFMARQIYGTLYGMAHLEQRQADGSNDSHRCLYFYDSVFFRYREKLDGAMVIAWQRTGVVEFAFYMNDYSPRLERLRQSSLALFFSKHGALYDQHEWESRGELVADFKADRKSPDAMLERVKEKYPKRDLRISTLKHSEYLIGNDYG